MALITSAFTSPGGPYVRMNAAGRCPVCGERNAACGGPTTHTPIDIPTQLRQEDGVSGPLRIYQITLAGRKVLLRLNQADAQRLGGTPATGTDPGTDTDNASNDPGEEKTRQPPNKARIPPAKSQTPGNG